MCFRFGSKNWMELAETTENEIIGVFDTFKSVDYSDKIAEADSVRLVINVKGF